MTSKDSKLEREKSFPERLKRFLKSDKRHLKSLPEIKITDELEADLGPNASLQTRLKTIRELEELVQSKKLQEASTEKIWVQVQDMLGHQMLPECRHAVLSLLTAICATSDRLAHNRILFLNYIKDNYRYEDTIPLFHFFRCVINDGRNIEYIEEDVGPFLIEWLPLMLKSFSPIVPVIELITNLVKFNAAHIDDCFIHKLVMIVASQLVKSNSYEEVHACLGFFDAIVAYVYIPSGTLSTFVCALTRLVSIPSIVEDAWKVMRNLLRTELGSTAICSLCEIIENSDNFHYVRGSIYFITTALWTKHKIPSLTFGPMAILPTLHRASESLHPLVIYETAISLSKLVRNHSSKLHLSSWDLLLDVLFRLFYFTANYSNKEQAQMIFNVMNSTVDDIEERIEDNQFLGTLSKFYDLVGCYSQQREVHSVLHILDYKIRKLLPDQNHWLSHLTSLMLKHFREDKRPAVRLQALAKLRYIFDKFADSQAEAICKSVVLTQLDEIENDPEMVVRKAAVSLLVHMVLSIQVSVIERILLIIEKIVLAPYSIKGLEELKTYKENEADDIYEGVKGLILIFKKKMWCLPSAYAIQAYQILMSSVELHYRNLHVLEKAAHIRKEIFDLIFEMRADANYHLGLPNCPDAQIPIRPDDPPDLVTLLPKYTCYIVVDHKYGQKPNSGFAIYHEPSPRRSSYDEDMPTQFLDREILSEEGKSNIAMSTDPFEETLLAKTKENLSTTIEENIASFKKLHIEEDLESASKQIINSGPSSEKSSDSEFSSLEPTTAVTHLSLTKAAMIVIVAMKKEKDWTLLKIILERIPQVLQNKALILSKDGNDIDYLATTLCALVTDKELNIPDSFRNTPPKFSKSDFNAYVYPVMASLASYHQHLDFVYQRNVIQCLQYGMQSKSCPQCVSAMTLCVLEMRTTMVKMIREVMITLSKISATIQNAQPILEFLSTLLHLPRVYSDFSPSQYMSVFAIAIQYTNPFKFNHYIVSLAYHVICMWFLKCRMAHRKCFVNFISKNLNMILLNEETANKMKSTATSDQMGKGEIDMIQFHKDLRETCVDFMARNCFDSYSPVANRSAVSQMLLNAGQQQMWIIGTRIISITTSGCSNRPIKQGLCDKCIQLCLHEDGSILSDPLPQQDSSISRRRHKSEFHRSVSHEAKHQPQSKDDLHMRSSLRETQPGGLLDQSDKLKNIEDPLSSDQTAAKEEKKEHLCACWCRGWAEIFIRQPTGHVAWMMRIQNPQTNVAAEDLLPIQDLSSFYLPSSQNLENCPFGKQDLLPSERYTDVYSPQLQGKIRPRAASGGSERTLASEAGLGIGEEWSNSGSGHSSGSASLSSSESKLNKVEGEGETSDKIIDPRYTTVYHCQSNPEVNKGPVGEASCDLTSESHKHHALAHSTSLIESSLGGRPDKKIAESRIGNAAVKRCHSNVGSPSPPPTSDQSSRTRHASAMQIKSCASPVMATERDEDSNLQPIKRGRGHTISDMNPASRPLNFRSFNRRPTIASTGSLVSSVCVTTASTSSLPSDASASISNALATSNTTSSSSSNKSTKDGKGGVSPSSVFLQLYYQGWFGGGCYRPILLPSNNTDIDRTIKLLDLIKPHENHKIGVLYVGPGQTTENQILKNTSGSERYFQFLEGLGTIFEVKDLSEKTFLGGIDRRGLDGNLVYMWQDDLMQVVFHVSTAIPNKETDPNCNNKKRHIGNNYVTIVYNNSGKPYNLNTIKSQFNHSAVEITPGDHNTNCVTLLTRSDLSEFVSWSNNDYPRLVSDASLPVLGRQLALHANLASTVWQSLKGSSYTPYATNWLEWLRKIRHLREKLLGKAEAERQFQEMQQLQFPAQDPNEFQNHSFLDFTDMIDIDKSETKERSRTAGFLNRR